MTMVGISENKNLMVKIDLVYDSCQICAHSSFESVLIQLISSVIMQ